MLYANVESLRANLNEVGKSQQVDVLLMAINPEEKHIGRPPLFSNSQ